MLKLNAKTGFTYRILKKSLDARKKPELFYTYSTEMQELVIQRVDRVELLLKQLAKLFCK